MDLFKVEGAVVKPTEHALLISPYSDIWERDPDPAKSTAIKELSYIEFVCSYKKSNPYKGLPEEMIKPTVIKDVFKGEEFEEDDLIKEGIDLYKKLREEAAPTLQYYLASKEGAEKTIKWLKEFDMDERNDRGVPIYKPADITRALKDTYEVMKTLNSMEEKVYEQIFESVKTKGNKEINHFER